MGYFLLLFFKGSSHFAFFHSKPNVRNSCTDGQFWYIFPVLETGFVYQILICSSCFSEFCVCSRQFPRCHFKIFFLTCPSPEEKEMALYWPVPHSQKTWSGMILRNKLLAILVFTRAVIPEQRRDHMSPLLQGHEGWEQQSLQVALIRPCSAVTNTLSYHVPGHPGLGKEEFCFLNLFTIPMYIYAVYPIVLQHMPLPFAFWCFAVTKFLLLNLQAVSSLQSKPVLWP